MLESFPQDATQIISNLQDITITLGGLFLSACVSIVVEHYFGLVDKIQKFYAYLINSKTSMKIMMDLELEQDYPETENKIMDIFRKTFAKSFRLVLKNQKRLEISDGENTYLFHYLGDHRVHFETSLMKSGIRTLSVDFNRLSLFLENVFNQTSLRIANVNIELFLPQIWRTIKISRPSSYSLESLKIIYRKDESNELIYSQEELLISGHTFTSLRVALDEIRKIW